MEIILTYEGRIPGQRRSPSNLDAIWEMRNSFDQQLSKLWGKEPFSELEKWEKPGYGPDTVQCLGGTTFKPFYSRKIGVGVELEIELLTGMPSKKSLIEAGDLDNRFKRVIDALRIPKKSEMKNHLQKPEGCHCLLEDDDAVLSIRAKLGTYLNSDDASVSFVIVTVRPIALRVSTDNISMLF